MEKRGERGQGPGEFHISIRYNFQQRRRQKNHILRADCGTGHRKGCSKQYLGPDNRKSKNTGGGQQYRHIRTNNKRVGLRQPKKDIKVLKESEKQNFGYRLWKNLSLDSVLFGLIKPQILPNKKCGKNKFDPIILMK